MKKKFELIVFTSLLFIFWVFSPSSTHKLRNDNKSKLVVGILTKKRENAFYLNKVVRSLNYQNVHIFDADKDHTDLKTKFNGRASIHNIYEGEYTHYLPFAVSTDAHTTHRYDGVKVVKSEIRKKWWRHQNMDFLKMVRYLRKHHKSDYYLIMEDDNVYEGDKAIINMIDYNEPVIHMGLGAGAVLMSDEFLESFIGYMSLRVDAQPVDWLMELFITSIGRKMVHNKIFKHVGSVSTKPDQRQGMF